MILKKLVSIFNAPGMWAVSISNTRYRQVEKPASMFPRAMVVSLTFWAVILVTVLVKIFN